MNCKPGDLAVIVRCRTAAGALNIGKIVRCKQTDIGPVSGNLCWITEPSVFDANGKLCLIADAHLRPIRDPGEDAKDETLEWLPVPEKVTA